MTFQTRAIRQFSVADQSSLESFGMDRFSALGDQASVFRASFDNLAGTGRALFNRLSRDPSVLGDSPDGSTITLAAPTVTTTTAGTVLAAGFTDFGFGDSQFAGRAVNPLQANISGDAIIARGEAAFISYETDTSAGGSPDALRFVLLTDIAAGTTIYITDRAWTGAAFTNAAGEGTLTYVAPSLQTAGTIITLTAAQLTTAGITLSNAGETLYMYQGGADAPTRFVFAMDIADGNGTFNGSLTNTGLVNGTSAVAVQFDNAVYAGTPTRIAAAQFADIATASRWHGTDTDDIGGTTFYTEVHDTTNTNAFNTPDMVMIVGMAGGGQSDAILRIGNDANDNGGNNVGSGLTRLFQDNPAFAHISDVSFDLENGFFFFVDSDGNFINRIMRGNIADIVNSNSSPTFTQIFATDGQNNGAGPVLQGEIINGIEINTATNKIYWIDGSFSGDFEGGWEVRSINYDGTGLALICVIDTENGMGSPFGISGVAEYAVRTSTNTMYVVSSLGSVDGFGNVNVLQNHILSVNLTTGAITILALDLADPRSNTGGGLYNEGRLNPVEGQIIALDVDQNTGIIYFATQPISASDSGGIFSYNPATDDLQELWNQPSNNTHNTLQTFPTNPITHLEVDEIGGRIYVSDISDTDSEFDATPATNEDDASIFSLAIGAALGTAPTLFQRVVEQTANGSPLGMEIDYAPVTAVTAANITYTESNNAPASPAGPPIVVITGSTVTDPDNTVIQGATVAITTGFSPGDTLSFTNSGGITGSYNAANGVVTFTGSATLAQYQTVLNSIRFTNAGDNPTDYGLSPSRTISFTTFDGLANSDPATASFTVVGINDAPVNTVPGAQAATEDAGKVITGISVADPDADPASQDIQVTLSVLHGTITLLTNVAGGIIGADVTNNGTATVTILATQNQINATIAASGLTYLNTADYNGADTLTITTNDLGLNGNDPGLTGTGTSEQDSDNVTINIAPVNDAPTVIDATQTAATILEDTPSVGGETVSSLFTASFSDALDQQQTGGNPTGSVANTLAGIAVVGGSTSASGSWQYFNGTIWVNIGAATTAAAVLVSAGTAIRFNPALNFNGSPPDLIVHLVDSSGAAITNGATVNLTGATGGTTRYSSATVALSESVTAVNDAPVNTVGGTLTVAEDSSATNVTGMSISDVDANPATDIFTVTLDVLHGTLILSIVVPGGVTAATGNGTATVTVTGTINQINATLAAAGGLTYTPTGNYNGSDRVQITTDDGGATGLDPGATGTATSEADIDSKTINVTAVNDPVTGAAPATLTAAEDATSVAVTGLSISDIDATLAPAGVYDVTLSATNGTLTLTTLAGLTFTVGDGTADATMTFHGTLAAINTALATAGYTPTANYNGSATITLNVTDTFGGIVATGTGAATNDSDVVNVTVTAVNDPVTGTAPATLTLNEDATNVAVTGLSISDIDTTLAPAGVYDVTLSATNGTLTLTTLAGLTFTAGDGTADATMTFHGTLAAINTALATATYTPTANYNGAATITLNVTDTFGGIVATGTGAATNDSDVINVTVTAQNDSPVVSVVASVGSIEQVAGTIDAAATIADLELGALNNYAGSSLTVGRNGGPAAQDLLTFGASGAFTVNGANLEAGGLVFATFAGGNGTNLVITFTGSGTPATQALVNAVVQSLQYTYTGDTPPASIVMNYSFNDGAPANAGQGGGGSPLGTDAITINITDTPENAPPVVDLNTGTGGINDTNVYAEGGAASGIGAAISVSDADAGDDIESATITITDSSPGDLLTVNLPLPAGISVDPSSTATTIILIGSASAAAYATALGQIGYSSSSDDPTVGGANPDRLITVTVNDGTDNSAPATMTMTVVGVNDEPTLVATGATPTLTEGGAAVDLFSAVSASTVEAGQTFTSLTLTVTNVTDGAAESLTFDGSNVALTNGNAVTTATNGLNVTVTVAAGTATVTFSGAALNAAQLQTLVDNLAYGNNSQNPTDADRVIAITQLVDSGSNVPSNDNTATLSIAATVNVDPVNDAPVNAVPGAQTINEDGSFTLSTGNGNAISVADVDATTLTVTLTVANGTLTLASTAGLSFGAGDGTADLTMTFSGTAAAINAALGSGLTYNPTANYNGPDSIQVVTSDNGQTGAGGTQSDTDSVAITVNPVNDEPTGTDNAVTINEDATYVFTNADFGFGDPVEGHALEAVIFTTLPVPGTLFYDADGPGGAAPVAVSAGQAILASEIALGKVTFVPAANANGVPFTSFTFQVRDNGGTTNGGVNTDQSPNTFTFSVTALNDAPVNSVPGAQTINEDGSFTLSTGNGNAISVADVDASTLTVTLTVTNGTLTLASTAGLSFGAGDGTGDLTMTFSGTAAAINAALGAGLTYNPTANYNGSDAIQVVTTDNGQTGSGGTQTDSDSIGITVNSVNDAPSGTDTTTTINEDSTYVFATSDFGFTDPIDGNSFLAVRFTTLPVNGTLFYDADGVGGAAPVAVSAGQSILASEIALGKVTFLPNSNANGAALSSFTFQVQDNGGIANGGVDLDQSPNTFTFNVTAVNDAPVNAVPGAQTINEDGSFTLSTGNGNAISVADVDATTLTVTLTVANGTLTLASTAGLSFGAGDGTADLTMTFSGTAAAINAALGSGLTYNPTANYNGPDSIQVVTTDNGQTGTGGTQSDTDSVAITVNSVNDAPSGANNTLTGSEDDPLVFTLADFGFSDPVEGNAFLAISVITFPAQGKLFLDPDGPGGAAPIDLSTVGSGVFVSASDIALGRLYFQPDPDEFGTGYASFTFKVQDDGGTLFGGVDLDPTANTITIDVTPDDLPPAVDLNGAAAGIDYATSFTEDGLAVAIGSGIVASDPDEVTLNDRIESATITLTDRVAGDSLTFASPLPGGFSAVTTNLPGSITIVITGSGTGAEYSAILDSIRYSTTNQDPTVGGTDLTRTVTVVVNDGDFDSATATATITINPVDDAPVAQPDTITTDEGTPVSGSLFVDNGSGADSDPDGPPLAISAVNGSGGNVGVQITLASGALLTVNANGTFSYDPNGAFDPTPTPGSGASNQPAHDSFTYTLAGGNTVTVTLDINGLDTDDLLIGTTGQDVLIAGAGNDTILGLADNDSIDGGTGIDTVIYPDLFVLYTDTVVGWATSSSENNDILTNVEIVQSGTQRNLLVGSTALASIQAASNLAVDDDIIRVAGGTWGGTVTYDDANLVVIAQPNAILNTTFTTATSNGITVFGGNNADNITTSIGNDVIAGGAGADVMAGGAGNDLYFVDNGGDVVTEAAGQGNDILASNVSYVLASGSEVELMTTGFIGGTSGIDLAGNELNNQIWGNNGANVLIGGDGADILVGFGGDDKLIGGNGADTMLGGAGDDLYFVDNAGDAVGELVGEGNDAVAAGVSYTLSVGASVELLTTGFIGGTAAIDLTGNELGNQIWGNNGANVLNGGDGTDVLFGFGGADTFAFTTALGAGNVDVIGDFASGTDKIALDDAVFTAMGSLGALNPNAFVAGTAAGDADDRIIYDAATGNIYYDADGNGAGAQVLFANIGVGNTLLASDFQVI
jgi:Ca2+-binding RTX toxin-like protein